MQWPGRDSEGEAGVPISKGVVDDGCMYVCVQCSKDSTVDFDYSIVDSPQPNDMTRIQWLVSSPGPPSPPAHQSQSRSCETD